MEDLPGFTGAGRNLTVPNVVGYDNIVQAIRQVWASPYTERAFGWRQALMDKPEHLYAAVLLHRSVNNDKSGVLVTADLDTNARDVLIVVTNEGVGGGVEGQSAETLQVRVADGEVTLLNSATAPSRSVLLPGGGEQKLPASGADRLLSDAELDQIREFSGRLPGWFTEVPEDERASTIADVEFGFFDGRLILYQIRPFVQSRGAARSGYLRELDAALRETAAVEVNMQEPPLEADS